MSGTKALCAIRAHWSKGEIIVGIGLIILVVAH